jgi:uncharacterized repeat protein (TIGR03803 family)
MFRILEISEKLLLVCGLAFAMVVPLGGAHATGFKVLYAFKGGSDGSFSHAGLIADQAGNLYGTTAAGGTSGGGTVFKLTPNGAKTELYAFCQQPKCDDGAEPLAGVIADSAGNLYGTTTLGGKHNAGTVFKLASDGTETVIFHFCPQLDCIDGRHPYAGLIMDQAGNLYGTTYEGGVGDGGTVFKLAPNGTETVLHAFSGGSDGYSPYAGLIMDQVGDLYGTTYFGGGTGCGGGGCGTVFMLAPNASERVLYAFCTGTNCPNGANPYAGLVADQAGNIYGATRFGAGDSGVVFKLDPAGKESVLYAFCSRTRCADGANPEGGLILDNAGNLYGTTELGGTHGGSAGIGAGTVFKLSPDGAETVLQSFTGRRSEGPYSSVLAVNGNLYGTTLTADNPNLGIVFELTQ